MVCNNKSVLDYMGNRDAAIKRQLDLKMKPLLESFGLNNVTDEMMDKIYFASKSITNTLRVNVGRQFEDAIESILRNNNIDYSKQVRIDSNGMVTKKAKSTTHIVDFVIPSVKINESINDKIIVSCKTTVRERILQDNGIVCKDKIAVTMDKKLTEQAIKNKYQLNTTGKNYNKSNYVPVSTILLPREDVPDKYFHSQKMIDGFYSRLQKNKEKGNGFGAQFLDLNQPSYTISARYYKDGADALVRYDTNTIRMLTERETARIQTFPEDYKFIGSSRDVYKQIGNAVPCLLAYIIGKQVSTYLQDV